MKFGELTPDTCPECHGVLSALRDGPITRYHYHSGHAFSADSLLAMIAERIEDSLYSAVRGIEESVMLLTGLTQKLATEAQRHGASPRTAPTSEKNSMTPCLCGNPAWVLRKSWLNHMGGHFAEVNQPKLV